MEEKILLEHEVQDKGKLEEELQRSKDELRGKFVPSSPLSRDSIDYNSDLAL
jgi:hypothetical protein